MPAAGRDVGPGTDVPSLPFVFEEIERVAAPPAAEFGRRYLRPRRPVILTGLSERWLPPECWSMRQLAERHGTARVIAAALADGTLHDHPRAGVVFERIELGR